jgi:hypothetical protein
MKTAHSDTTKKIGLEKSSQARVVGLWFHFLDSDTYTASSSRFGACKLPKLPHQPNTKRLSAGELNLSVQYHLNNNFHYDKIKI